MAAVDSNICRHCLRSGTRRFPRCSGCEPDRRYYCSRRCQKLDWPRHRFFCRGNSAGIDTYDVNFDDMHLCAVDDFNAVSGVVHLARRACFADTRLEFCLATQRLFQRCRAPGVTLQNVDEVRRTFAHHSSGPAGRADRLIEPAPADQARRARRARRAATVTA